MKNSRTPLVLAIILLLLLAVIGADYFHLFARGGSASPRPAAPPVASVAAPLTAPAQAVSPAAQSAPPAAAAAAKQPFTEAQFIEISSTMVLLTLQVQHQPDATKILEPMMEKVLSDAGVTIEEFNAFAEQVYADPERSRTMGDKILDRVGQRSTPQMRLQAVPMAKAMAGKFQHPSPSK
jgi:hypothetical protein